MKLDMKQKLALNITKAMRKVYENYEEAALDEAKRGYSMHYCIHGTNLWTDYDNICGGCENGESYFDYMRELRYAKDRVDSTWEKCQKRRVNLVPIISDGADGELINKLLEWATEPMVELEARYA